MVFNKRPYKCILYDDGDIVFPKFPDDRSVPRKVLSSRLDVLGNNTVTQFLKLEGLPDDLNVSNLYVPYGEETRRKYENGFVYFEGLDKDGKVKTTSQTKVVITPKKASTIPDQSEIIFNPFKKP